jgi:hypothetical protein
MTRIRDMAAVALQGPVRNEGGTPRNRLKLYRPCTASFCHETATAEEHFRLKCKIRLLLEPTCRAEIAQGGVYDLRYAQGRPFSVITK